MAHRPSLRATASHAVLGLLTLLSGGPAAALVITEIHYDPAGPPAAKAKLKFIEVFNELPTTVDLTGYRFGEGVIYSFPARTLLGGRKYLVVCADAAEIQRVHGIANALGDFEGNLSEDGDDLVLLNEGGGIGARVDFRDRGRWPSGARGSGYTLSLKHPYADPGRPESWTLSRLPGGTPGAENFPPPYLRETEVFGEVSDWVYKKGWDGAAMAPFSDPPGAWWLPGFDDAGWTAGKTGIGFAGNDDQTVLSDMMNNYVAFAARKRFTLPPEVYAEIESAVLRIRVDDGFAAYLNGAEVGRFNVGTDPDVPFDKPATGSRASTQPAIVLNLPRQALLEGENVLAVQVHNQALAGNDASFLPSLVWLKTVRTEVRPPAPLRLNEVLRYPGAGGGARWLELYNQSDAPLDAAGMAITADPSSGPRHVLPPGTGIPARGFLILSEAELPWSLAGAGEARELRLYIFEKDLVTLADAAVLEARAAGGGAAALSQARVPDGTGGWLITPTPTPGRPNEASLERDVVINEIMYHPLTGPSQLLADGRTLERGEYVELLNRGDRAVSLTGWALTKGFNYVFPPGTSLPPGAYLVVAPDPEYIRSTYSLPVDAVLGPEADPKALAAFGTLSNGGETIQLEDALGNAVQEVRYEEGGGWSSLADSGGSSLELVDAGQDNTVPHAWEPSDETGKAPWTQISYTANHVVGTEAELWLLLLDEGECLIDEVSVKRGEVEHIPNGGFETSTAPWRIEGTHIRSKRTTAEAHAGSACLHLIASGGGDNRVNRVEVDTSPRLPGGAATVSFWARWLKGAPRLHSSGYNNNSLAVNHLLPVPANLGTPGAENGATARLRLQTGAANLGPVTSAVRHLPAVPSAGTEVTVLARITDPDGVREAKVEYRLGRKTAAALSVPLFDDGQHGDGEAGDGLFAGTIPPQPNLAKVLFNVAATDGGDRTRRFPADAPARTLLYQVGDTYESPALRYRLILDDESEQTLRSRRLHSDDLVDAAFVFEESEVYYNVGVRYHGSPWNRPPDPKMFRVRFNDDKPLLGYNKMNISRYGSAPNEGTAYQLCRLASGGEAARTTYSPRYTYIKVHYNGRPHSSTALAEIIPPGGDYFRTHFPRDAEGYAYKLTGKLDFTDAGDMAGVSWTALRFYGPSKESFRYFFNPATRPLDDDFDPLIKLLQLLDPTKTPLAKFEDPVDGIESICNVEAFLRLFIIRVLQDDWDTVGIQNGQNAYLYYAPREGRFYLLPWDMDHTFNDPGARIAPAELTVDPGMRRWVNDSAKYRRAYLRILREYLTTFWNSAAMSPWLDAVAAEMKNLVGLPSGIKGFMTSRVTTARGRVPQIAREFKFAITSPAGGRDLAVKGKDALIGGTAPLEIVRIEMVREGSDPVEVDPIWTANSVTDWKLSLSLAPEQTKARFQLFGFNSQGDLVGDVLSITVHDSTGWAQPAIESVEPASGPPEGGTAVTIAGSGFRDGLTVVFGGKPAVSVARSSDTEVRATSPAAAGPGPVDLRVANLDGQSAVLAGGFTYSPPGPAFIRGDVDGTLVIDITDPILILGYQFLAGDPPACLDTADADDTGVIDISDPIHLLHYLYNAGAPPPPPFPDPGADPTQDSLGC